VRSDLLTLVDMRLRLSIARGGFAVGGELAPLVRYGTYGAVEALVECALVRDPYTRLHLLHVNHIANAWLRCWGSRVRCTSVWCAPHCSRHRKAADPGVDLLKPARLETDEYATMQRHASTRTILSGYPDFADVARIVGQHHERWDGLGYPLGLRGGRSDPLARAVSVIDAFSAMTLDRPYHRASRRKKRCSSSSASPRRSSIPIWSRRSSRCGAAAARGTRASAGVNRRAF